MAVRSPLRGGDCRRLPLAVFGSPAAVHVPVKGKVVRVLAADLADGGEREIAAPQTDGLIHLDEKILREVCAAHPQGILGVVFRICV